MEFFDKKEEVIEIKLTQFCKRVYADGKFNPKFYAFFDDDIIYDTSYAGYTEVAHSASTRIKDAPRMKIQSALYGIESDIIKKIEGIRRTNGNIAPENLQQIKEKSYVLTNALGKSDRTKDYAPAWEVKSYANKISSSARTINDSGKLNEVQILQINMDDLKYKIRSIHNPDFNAEIFGHVFEDNTALTVDTKEGEMLIGLREANSPLSNEKFEIEVFMVNEENGQENLVPLYFKKKVDRIVNDVLLDDVIQEEEDIDETYVEKYLSIETDTGIDEDFMRENLGSSAKMTDMEEIRTFGISGQFLSDTDAPSSGLLGSSTAADLSPDEIASMSAKSLEDMEADSDQLAGGKIRGRNENRPDSSKDQMTFQRPHGNAKQTSGESIYNKVPPNPTTDSCEDEEE